MTSPPGAAPSWRKALLQALLVLAAGAAVGAAGFATEQRLHVWEPAVASTATGGWLVTGSPTLRPVAPVVVGGRLAWRQGRNLCLLDLLSGEPRVIGVAPRGVTITAPAADGDLVAWLETPQGVASSRPAHLWVYEAKRRRRQSFAVGPRAASPAVDGGRVAWFNGGRVPDVRALDVATGRRSTIVEGPSTAGPVVAGGGYVGWLRWGGVRRAPRVVVSEGATEKPVVVRLAEDEASGVADIQMRRGVLLWSVRRGLATTIVAYDVRSRRRTTVAAGVVAAAATDGKLVVWATPADGSPEWVILGSRIRGDRPAEIARLTSAPTSLAVGDGWLAWTFADGASPGLQAQRIAL